MTVDRSGRWLALFVGLSLAAHAAAYGSLGKREPAPRRPPQPTTVTMEVVPRPPPPPAPAPPPRAPAPRAPRLAVAAPRPAAPPPPAAPAPPPVADFTGVTLTNDGPGTGWASAVGDGRALNGPIGPALRPAAPAPAAPAAGPPVVGPADLTQAPEAPVLDQALARNYPDEERRQGLTGVAVVRARILPDGHVRPLKVVSASTPAFAEACKRTLADSRWSQPRDREARPCATDISYTCRFELGQ
jgi:outer membrane biosynthesis protein TonB